MVKSLHKLILYFETCTATLLPLSVQVLRQPWFLMKFTNPQTTMRAASKAVDTALQI